MTDRERLIELISHKQEYGVVPVRSQMDDRKVEFAEVLNSTVSDYLLANGGIVPPETGIGDVSDGYHTFNEL